MRVGRCGGLNVDDAETLQGLYHKQPAMRKVDSNSFGPSKWTSTPPPPFRVGFRRNRRVRDSVLGACQDIMKMLLPSPEHNATAIRGVPLVGVLRSRPAMGLFGGGWKPMGSHFGW